MMRITFPARHRAWGLLLCIVILAATSCTGEHPGNDKPWMTRIPNTERMSGALCSMYVSPGEEWITFFESNDAGLPAGLASVEMATGRRIEHHLEQVPAADMSRFGDLPFLSLESAQGFRTGWHGGMLYLQNPARGRHDALVVVNSKPAITCGPMPRGRLMVSDGPELGSWYTAVKSRPDGNNAVNGGRETLGKFSAAWRNGRFDATTYAYDKDSRSIVAHVPGRKVREIASLPNDGIFQNVVLSKLRVSPNQSYLAYVLGYSSALIPFPIKTDLVKVVDLTTGKTRTVCNFQNTENLYWSGDDTRLFLSGHDSNTSKGVYVVDVSKAFGVSRD